MEPGKETCDIDWPPLISSSRRQAPRPTSCRSVEGQPPQTSRQFKQNRRNPRQKSRKRFLAHLESVMSVVLLSRDSPRLQRDFANSRNWRFRLASHGGGSCIREQSVMEGGDNTPGAVLCERSGPGAAQKRRHFRPRRPVVFPVEPAGTRRHRRRRLDA